MQITKKTNCFIVLHCLQIFIFSNSNSIKFKQLEHKIKNLSGTNFCHILNDVNNKLEINSVAGNSNKENTSANLYSNQNDSPKGIINGTKPTILQRDLGRISQSENTSTKKFKPIYKFDFSDQQKFDSESINYFKNYSKENWESYFSNQINLFIEEFRSQHTDLLFENFALFQFDNYINFLKSFPCFDKKILELENKINTDPKFKIYISRYQNFPIKRIQSIASLIQEREIYKKAASAELDWQKSVQSLETQANNNDDSFADYLIYNQKQIELNQVNSHHLESINNRISALNDFQKNGNVTYLKEYKLNQQAIDKLKKSSISVESFQKFHGNCIQQQLHSEIIQVLNESCIFNSIYKDKISNSIIAFSTLSQKLNSLGQVEQTSKLLDACHGFMSFCKGVENAVLHNKDKVLEILENPFKFIKNFTYGLGKTLFNATRSFVDFVLHPRTDQEYQKQIDDICKTVYEKYKDLPKNEIYEKIGYEIIDLACEWYLLKATSIGLVKSVNLTKKTLNFVRNTKIGNQTAKTVGLIAKHGTNKLADASKILLEEQGIIQCEEVTRCVASTNQSENFIPQVFEAAVQYSKETKAYKTEVVQNLKRYNNDPTFRAQYDNLRQSGIDVPIQILPKGIKLDVTKLPNGDIKIVDKLGNIATYYGPNNLNSGKSNLKLSPSGRRSFGYALIDKNAHTIESIGQVKIEDLKKKFDPIKFVEQEKVESINPAKKFNAKKFEDLLIESKTGSSTKHTPQYEKAGGYDQALKDFESLDLEGIKPNPNKEGFIGFLKDGRTVNVRIDSKEGRPTLELLNPTTKRKIKIRYD